MRDAKAADAGERRDAVADARANHLERDATPSARDAGSSDAARQQASAQREIYAADECPARLLPSELAPRPTQYCSGRTGECWEEAPCQNAGDCSARPFGRCTGFARADDGGYIEYARCEYDGCLRDEDCDAGEACVCGLQGLGCFAAPCRKDEDCPERQACIRSDVCGLGPYGDFVCASERDECQRNEDCFPEGNSCALEDGHLVCTGIICD